MGIGGISIWQLLIILAIVVMLFGTKKLRNLGSDLGGALKGFKTAMKDEDGKNDEIDEVNDHIEENVEETGEAETINTTVKKVKEG